MYEDFVIKCLKCGSEEVWIHNDIDYERSEIVGHHLHCINCGHTSE